MLTSPHQPDRRLEVRQTPEPVPPRDCRETNRMSPPSFSPDLLEVATGALLGLLVIVNIIR